MTAPGSLPSSSSPPLEPESEEGPDEEIMVAVEEDHERGPDILTSLHYTKLPNVAAAEAAGNGAVGPMIWGHTAFEADREELVPVTVRNIRGSEARFSLDASGFQIVRHATALSPIDFLNRTLVKGRYYAEIQDVLKRATGASLVKITHHVLRRSRVADPDNLRMTRPITQVHVDSNDERIRQTVRAIFGGAGGGEGSPAADDEAERLLAGRYAMVNVWRPLRRCRRDPLAFCDGSTVADACYMPREIVMPGSAQRQVNTGVAVVGNGDGEHGHHWYYLHAQRPDEVLLLKCWDSKPGVVRRCPHSSIPADAAADAHLEDRESIELRCLLFWQD